MVAPVANRPSLAPKTATSQRVFPIVPPPVCQQSWRPVLPFTSHKEIPRTHATATTTDTGQTTSRRTTTPPTTIPATQTERSAANRLRSTMAAVRLAFTWLGTRKTLLPEQRDTAARAFHADRELLSATKLILDTKH
jgi:hypothetical protein